MVKQVCSGYFEEDTASEIVYPPFSLSSSSWNMVKKAEAAEGSGTAGLSKGKKKDEGGIHWRIIHMCH